MSTLKLFLAITCFWCSLFTLLYVFRVVALMRDLKCSERFMSKAVERDLIEACLWLLIWLSISAICFHSFFTLP